MVTIKYLYITYRLQIRVYHGMTTAAMVPFMCLAVAAQEVTSFLHSTSKLTAMSAMKGRRL